MWTSVCSIDVQSNRRRLHKTISETRPSNVTPFVLDGCWALDGLDQPTMRWLSKIAKRKHVAVADVIYKLRGTRNYTGT